MNINEVRSHLYDITEEFFKKATVVWEEQIMTTPKMPYITLATRNLKRKAYPYREDINSIYSYETTFEVNLYTKGRKVSLGDSATANYENTAVADLMDFCNYMESESVTDALAGHGISIALIQPIRDLSELLNDSKYRFRSMSEFTVGFVSEANGPYGVGGLTLPNYSGGGSEEMATSEEYVIEGVEIIEE